MKGNIYKITNTLNNKVYVGKPCKIIKLAGASIEVLNMEEGC